MRRKRIIALCIVILFYTYSSTPTHAGVSLKIEKHENINVLFMYTTLNNEETELVRKIDLLLHHFTDHVTMIPESKFTDINLASYSHIVYYGDVERTVNEHFISELAMFDGDIFVIGENVKQIQNFQFILPKNKVTIQAASFDRKKTEATPLQYGIETRDLTLKNEHVVYLYGHSHDRTIPLLVANESHYYLSLTQWDETIYFYVAEFLHTFFQINHTNEHIGYVLIDDIHPNSNEEMLLAIGEKLTARGIPYMLAVSPVFIDLDKEEKFYLSNSKKLLRVLQQLQADGATIIAKGYVRAYSTERAHMLFEFWDEMNDQFYTGEDVGPFRMAYDFANKELYEQYIEPLHKAETNYMKTRIERAIEELTYDELFPLAFTVPEYRVSKNGYEVISNHYTTLFGKLQWSDKTAQHIGAPPFITTASFLHGTTFVPETISAYSDANVSFTKDIERALLVRDSVLNITYSAYLQADELIRTIDTIEQYTNVSWLPLHETKQRVQSTNVSLASNESGTIEMERNVRWWNDLFRYFDQTVVELVLWTITAIVLTFILLFTLFTLRLRAQRKKRLFKEKK